MTVCLYCKEREGTIVVEAGDASKEEWGHWACSDCIFRQEVPEASEAAFGVFKMPRSRRMKLQTERLFDC